MFHCFYFTQKILNQLLKIVQCFKQPGPHKENTGQEETEVKCGVQEEFKVLGLLTIVMS